MVGDDLEGVLTGHVEGGENSQETLRGKQETNSKRKVIWAAILKLMMKAKIFKLKF